MIDVRELYSDNQEIDHQEPTAKTVNEEVPPVNAATQAMPPNVMEIDKITSLDVLDTLGVHEKAPQADDSTNLVNPKPHVATPTIDEAAPT